MRLSNALASGTYYKGEFDSSLKWITEAWEYAERSGADSFKPRILFNRAGLFYGLGRHRDSVDQHKVAAIWARRTGNRFDYLSACAGMSINLIQLAQYEAAIEEAIKTGKTALQIGDVGEQAKALELEALAYLYIGDYGKSERLADEGLRLMRERGYEAIRVRLDWLKARLLIQNSYLNEAEKMLRAAEAVLLETQDWEDLPCVQIELLLLESQSGDAVASLRAIGQLTRSAESSGGLVVQLYGASALAEIMLTHALDDSGLVKQISAALARADQSGVAETGWWLSYCLGEIASRRGEPREAQSCFRRAVQVLGQIAQDLSPANRKLYLDRPHTRSALARLMSVEKSLVSGLAPPLTSH
jgi:tetratricopeptide (TPR) repeat protein